MSKKNIILAGALILLVGFAYLYQGPYKNWRASSAKPKNFLAKIAFSDVNKIDITKNGKTLTIEKMDDKWKIAGTKDFYVNTDTVKKISESINSIAKADIELVSNNKDKKKDFQTDAQGTAVKLYKKQGIIADFVLGKSNDDMNYIVAVNSDKTYRIKTDLKLLLDDNDNLYDKKMFTANKSDFNRVRFQYSDSEFTVEKNKKDKWEGILPFKFDVADKKIDPILETMSSLTAVKIPEQTFKGTGLEKSQLIIQASSPNSNNTLMIGNKDKEGNFYAKKGDSDNIYLISKEQKDILMKKMKDLK